MAVDDGDRMAPAATESNVAPVDDHERLDRHQTSLSDPVAGSDAHPVQDARPAQSRRSVEGFASTIGFIGTSIP